MTAADTRARWRERLCVLALLFAALLPRARDFFEPFDREFEGAQGAFFAIGAVNYERLGIARSGGYPVLNIDLGARADMQRGLWNHPQSWYLYANHPPLVPLAAWAAISLGAAHDWDDAWRDGRPPAGIEPWIRAPFLAASVLTLLAFWWAVRQAAGPRRAMLALAIAAALPVSVVYGTLVNYENPALLCAMLAFGFFARWIRGARQRDLALCALAFAAGSCVTFTGLFFLPPLALAAWSRRGLRCAAGFTATTALVGFAPIALHAGWSTVVEQRLGLEPAPLLARARELWEPLLDGSHPLSEWASLQVERIGAWFTWPLALAACAGLAICIVAAVKRFRARDSSTESPDREWNPEAALLAGGAMFLLAFYKHTLDPQFTFLMLLAPGIAGLAALALDRAALRIASPRGRAAILILATSALAAFALERANELRFDFRAPAGAVRADRNPPSLPLPDATGRELATLVPSGGFGIHPACLGLNHAVSFYAWRSLWPASHPQDTWPEAVAQHFGLGAAPHVLLLPKDPWPSIAGSIADFERALVNNAPPDRESTHWRAWDLH